MHLFFMMHASNNPTNASTNPTNASTNPPGTRPPPPPPTSCGTEGDEPVRLQVGQGDTISGRVSRGEVGQAVVAALSSPYAAGRTFELRRDEVT